MAAKYTKKSKEKYNESLFDKMILEEKDDQI